MNLCGVVGKEGGMEKPMVEWTLSYLGQLESYTTDFFPLIWRRTRIVVGMVDLGQRIRKGLYSKPRDSCRDNRV